VWYSTAALNPAKKTTQNKAKTKNKTTTVKHYNCTECQILKT
jgi:hypothetical protein